MKTLIKLFSSIRILVYNVCGVLTLRVRVAVIAGFLLTGLAACSPFEKDLTGVWFYKPSAQRSKKDSLLTATSFLQLQSNGAYTSDLGHYDHGSWTAEGNVLALTNSKGKTIRLPIEKHTRHELHLFANENWVVSFDKYPAASGKANPFSQENNRWRLPARQPESDAEIRARLYNHCRFWETYFAWALEKEINSIDVRSTPTPIKIYGNGFGLKKFEELPYAWRQYFYDTTDCRKAEQMLKDVFRKRNIKWPETDVTYKKFISAFQQLQAQLK